MRQSVDRSRDPMIAVARAFLEGQPLRHAMRAVAALDWEATVARAESERLAPILYIAVRGGAAPAHILARLRATDRKSTRLNSSHSQISYAVFCLKKKT